MLSPPPPVVMEPTDGSPRLAKEISNWMLSNYCEEITFKASFLRSLSSNWPLKLTFVAAEADIHSVENTVHLNGKDVSLASALMLIL